MKHCFLTVIFLLFALLSTANIANGAELISRLNVIKESPKFRVIVTVSDLPNEIIKTFINKGVFADPSDDEADRPPPLDLIHRSAIVARLVWAVTNGDDYVVYFDHANEYKAWFWESKRPNAFAPFYSSRWKKIQNFNSFYDVMLSTKNEADLVFLNRAP